MIAIDWNSTGDLIATVTDADGAAVTGATVTATIKNGAGTALVTDVTLTEGSGGDYAYKMAATLLATQGAAYRAEITVIKSSDQAYAEADLQPLVNRA